MGRWSEVEVIDMTVFQFMSESPYLTFFICYMLTQACVRVWARFIRHLNIRKHGWPPSHCDADGDFKPVKDEDSENTCAP
jgi:hypothetical protein